MKIIPLPFETVALTGWTHKVEIAYTDVNTTAGTSKTLTIFPDGSSDAGFSDATLAQLPAGFQVEKLVFQLITPFTGGAISAGTLTVGDKATANRYLASTATDLFTASGTNTKDNVASATTYCFSSSDVAASNAQLTATLASTGANWTACTAGLLVIYLALADPNDLSTVNEPGSV